MGLDAHLYIDREAGAVFPRGQHPRVLCQQQSAPQGRAQHWPAHGGLKTIRPAGMTPNDQG